MRITNATLTVPRSDSRTWLERVATELNAHLRAGRYPLRAAIARLTEREALIPLIAVEENETLLEVTNDKMGMRNVIPVRSYLEAAGVILALRQGISLESLRRPIGCATLLESDAVHHEACA
jgi:hypothetical protein